MKITLVLSKTFEIDLEKDTETKTYLMQKVSENEDDTDPDDVVLDTTNIYEAVESILEDDLESLIDLDINETDFTIKVTS